MALAVKSQNKMNTYPKMHVSLYVSEMDRTVAFYEKLFAQSADKVKPGYAKFMLDDPALVISFVENKDKVKSNFGHLGIQLQKEDQVISHLDRLKTDGIAAKEEMGVSCCYAKQDKFWVADPDGHQWEYYYFHEDVEFNDPHYAATDNGAPQEDAPVCTPGSGCC